MPIPGISKACGVTLPKELKVASHCSATTLSSTHSWASATDKNKYTFKRSCRNQLLKASMMAQGA